MTLGDTVLIKEPIEFAGETGTVVDIDGLMAQVRFHRILTSAIFHISELHVIGGRCEAD